MRIFLDANILFSAAKTDGLMRALLGRLRKSGHVLCSDAFVEAEAIRNLERKGPEALSALQDLLVDIERHPFRRHILRKGPGDVLPDKDRPVLAAAVGLGCDVLLTGDRTHFGKLFGMTIDGVAVHSPQSLTELLAERT